MSYIVAGKTAGTWALAHWKILGVLAIVGFLGWRIYSLDHENAQLKRDAQTKVSYVTREDLDKALAAQGQSIFQQFKTFASEFKIVQTPAGPVFLRVTTPPGEPSKPGAPGKPGTPGAPGKPGPAGTPGNRPPAMIPPAEAPTARAAAIEKVRIRFREGTLIAECVVEGLPEGTIELLRNPQGAFASTSWCVDRIEDEVNVPPVAPSVAIREFSRWKAVAAYSLTDRRLGAGIAFEAIRLGKFSLDAVALGIPKIDVGFGVSYSITVRSTLGLAYALNVSRMIECRTANPRPPSCPAEGNLWLYYSHRF